MIGSGLLYIKLQFNALFGRAQHHTFPRGEGAPGGGGRGTAICRMRNADCRNGTKHNILASFLGAADSLLHRHSSSDLAGARPPSPRGKVRGFAANSALNCNLKCRTNQRGGMGEYFKQCRQAWGSCGNYVGKFVVIFIDKVGILGYIYTCLNLCLSVIKL